MVSRFKANPVGVTLTKPAFVKKPYLAGRNIPGKKIVSTGIGVAVKENYLNNKSLLFKRNVPIEHLTAKKLAVIKKDVAVKKIAAMEKPGVSTKMLDKVNKSEPVNKVLLEKAERPKKPTVVKTVAPVDNAKAENSKSVPASKTDVTITTTKELPKKEEKEPLQTTACKTSSPAKTTQETELENEVYRKIAEVKPTIDKRVKDAGDDKNISELNIDKGQLNNQNSLYVKIFFADRPPKGTLTEFINKYNLESFKRIDNGVNLFAAKLNNINDFECICNAKEIYCGQVKVTVKPCYKYTSLPPKSSTNNNDKDNLSKSNDNCDKENTLVKNAKKEEMCKQIDEEKSTIKSVNETEDTNKSLKDYKEGMNLEHGANASNTSPLEPDNTSTETLKETKPVININVKVVANTSNVNATKDTSSTKKNIESDNIGSSVNANSLQSNNKLGSQHVTESKASIVNIKHEQRKVIKNVQKKSKSGFSKEVGGISKNKFEGDEEVDDLDVLALISEGIVLDECCDSDQEL